MKELRILGVLVNNRKKDSITVQHILTKFGCSIKTRLGLHEVSDDKLSNYGLILLELTGDPSEWDKLEQELLKIDDVSTNKMSFEI